MATDGKQMQEEDPEESLRRTGGQRVKTAVGELVVQQGGCGMTRLDLGGLSRLIEGTESVVEVVLGQNDSVVLGTVALHWLVVVCRAKPEDRLGVGDVTRMLARQMDLAVPYYKVLRVEALGCAGASLLYGPLDLYCTCMATTGWMCRMSFVLAKRAGRSEGAGMVGRDIQSKKQTSLRVFGGFGRRWGSWSSCWEVEGWRRRCS